MTVPLLIATVRKTKNRILYAVGDQNTKFLPRTGVMETTYFGSLQSISAPAVVDTKVFIRGSSRGNDLTTSLSPCNGKDQVERLREVLWRGVVQHVSREVLRHPELLEGDLYDDK